MPENLTDSSEFTTPIVVPVGTDPRTAASVKLLAQGLANRAALLGNRTKDPTDEEFKYLTDAGVPNPKNRRLRIPGTRLTPRSGALVSSTNNPGRLQLDTNSAFYEVFFDLPAGVRIVAVRALVTPGAARAGANRMQFGAFSRPINPFSNVGFGSATAIGAAAADAGNTNFQVIEVTGLTHDVAEADVHWLFVQAGNTAASNGDWVTCFEVEYTATGPRSY